MANMTSSRPWFFRSTRRLAITAIGGVVAVLVIAGTLTLAALNLSHVHASGTGGGGCYPISGTAPACTFKGHSGTAQFEVTSSCAITDIWVFASDDFTRTGATTTQGSFVNVNTNTYNSCTDTYSWGYGYDSGTVQLSQTSGTFTAQGNVNVDIYNSDGTTSAATYTLNLTWKSYGKSSSQISMFHYQSAGILTQSHFTGTSQNAYVSGTLSDGTTNFAATGTASGEMISADSGSMVTIQK